MEVHGKIDEGQGPIMDLLSKRIRSKKKKLREIGNLEQAVKDGKAMTEAMRNRIERKADLIVEVNELESLKMLLPKAIAAELSSKGSKTDESSSDSASIDDENRPVQDTKIDGSAQKKDSVPNENGPAQSAKNAESGEPIISVAQVEVDQNIEKQCYRFLKRYKLEGDEESLYHGDALALVSRRSMRLQYSDIYMHDKSLAMQICAGYERLKPSITQAAKRFAKEVLKNTVKGLTPQNAKAVKDNVENLNLTVIGKPKSHQMLDTILQPRSIVIVDEVSHIDKENPMRMKTLSDIGSAVLMGTLKDLIAKHLQGLSCNGVLGIENVELYNGDRYVINSPLVRYSLGSSEWAVACKKDFNSYSDSFMPLFGTIGKLPPYMAEFYAALSTVPLHVLQNRVECLVFHEFVLNHLAGKPLPVRAALSCGIHNCCKSYDPDDPDAPFKKIMQGPVEIPEVGVWTKAISESENKLLIKLLTTRLKNGVEIDCKYSDDMESMNTYMRVLYEHGSNYTKDRKKKNQGKPNRWNKSNQNQRNKSNVNQHTGQNLQNLKQNTRHNQTLNMNQNENMNLNQNIRHNQTVNMNQRNSMNLNQNIRHNQTVNMNQRNQNLILNQNIRHNQTVNMNLNQNIRHNQTVNMNLNQNIRHNQTVNMNLNQNIRHNQTVNMNLNQELNDASTSQQSNQPDEPQNQRLKLLNELEFIGAQHLAPYFTEMIYTLLRRKAMTGMLLPVWKAFKSSNLSGQGQ